MPFCFFGASPQSGVGHSRSAESFMEFPAAFGEAGADVRNMFEELRREARIYSSVLLLSF